VFSLVQEVDLLGRDGHCQSTCFFVGCETDDIESTGDDSIDQQCNSFTPRHLSSTVCSHSIELAGKVSIDHTLDECQWGHAHEEVEWVELESVSTARLDEIGDDCLECCEECSE
jgi:hypothetical protein